MVIRTASILLATAALWLPSQVVLGQQWPKLPFVDVTASHVPQDPGLHALDAEVLDVDGDGDLDVAIAVERGVNRLYINDGKGRLRWEPGAFGTIPHDSEHVRAADFNKDGYADLIFIAEDDQQHQLFLGGPNGVFTDASDRLPSRSEGNGLAVGDVNGDGFSDIVIGNSDEPRPGKVRSSAQNFLWLNDPARPGHFLDATATHLPKDNDGTQGIALGDIDGDGDLDMVVANEDAPPRLLINNGRGHFRDASDRLDLTTPMETREVHIFDANGDGRPDILFFNLTSNNQGWDKDPQTRLLIADTAGRFSDETAVRLPRHRFSSWGGKIVDFNQDGAPDIIVSAIQIPGFVPLQVRAWQNDGKGNFHDATLTVIPALTVGRAWSIAAGDFDGDGKDDLFIGQWGTQARLLLTAPGRLASEELRATH